MVKTQQPFNRKVLTEPSDLRRDVATHGEAEGCETERETGRFEHRRLSAWTPNPEGSVSH